MRSRFTNYCEHQKERDRAEIPGHDRAKLAFFGHHGNTEKWKKSIICFFVRKKIAFSSFYKCCFAGFVIKNLIRVQEIRSWLKSV